MVREVEIVAVLDREVLEVVAENVLWGLLGGRECP